MAVVAIAFQAKIAHGKMNDFLKGNLIATKVKTNATACSKCQQGFAVLLLRSDDPRNFELRDVD